MGFPRRGFVDSLALAAAVLVTIGAVSTQAATDLRMPITATPIYKGIGGHKSNQMLQPPFAPLRSGPKAASRPSRQKQIPGNQLILISTSLCRFT